MRFLPSVPLFSALSILMLGLGGCAFLIPEDPSAPRYNSVGGERHRPQLNSMTPQGSAAPIATIPMAQNDSDLRGVPAQPSAPMPVNAPPVQAYQPPVQMPMNQPVAPVAVVNLPPVMASDPSQTLRHMPVENAYTGRAAGEFSFSENNYPPLSSVPPRPLVTGDDSAASRLGRVRSELENDRNHGNAERDQLNRDAASEPPLLDHGPAWETLPNAASPSEKRTRPPGSSMNLSPTPVVNGIANGASNAAGNAPITLRAPMNNAPTATAARIIQHAPVAQAMSPAIKGGFNPMADAALTDGSLTVTYANEGYLPSSRYAALRN